MLVSDLLFSLSLSTTALFRPPGPLSAAEEEGGGGVGVEMVLIVEQSSLLLMVASLSGVIFFGLPSGISFSSRLGTLDWSKSWSTLEFLI